MPDQDRPLTPPSRAVLRARKHLTPKSHTPRFDPDVHKSPVVQRSPVRSQHNPDFDRRDSFLDVIEIRSPVKLVQPRVLLEEKKETEEVVVVPVSPGVSMASPVGSPLTPNTRLRLSRIEDSLEALDDMEDALDEVKQSLAKVGEQRPQTAAVRVRNGASNEKDLRHNVSSDNGKIPSQIAVSPARTPLKTPARRAMNSTRKPTPKPVTVARSPPRTIASRGVAASNRLAALRKEPKPGPKTTKAPAVPAVKPRPVPPAARKPFVPTKSSKPTTTSAFQLPGEAVAARLKTQREARAASNASATGPAAGSAKGPTRPNSAAAAAANAAKRKSTIPGPEVRMTAAARARIGAPKGEKPAALSGVKTRQVIKPTAAPSIASKPTTASAVRSVKPRPSSLYVAGVKADAAVSKTVPTKPAANTPVKRTGSGRLASVVTGAKVDSGLKRTASADSPQPAKKPATVSTKVPLNDRADAAKKARADAAERGRIASQQWAEKMKKRQSAGLAAKDVPGQTA